MKLLDIKKLIRKIKCLFGHHTYEVSQVFSAVARRVGCRTCGGVWIQNDQLGTYDMWNSDYYALYSKIKPIVYQDWEFTKE